GPNGSPTTRSSAHWSPATAAARVAPHLKNAPSTTATTGPTAPPPTSPTSNSNARPATGTSTKASTPNGDDEDAGLEHSMSDRCARSQASASKGTPPTDGLSSRRVVPRYELAADLLCLDDPSRIVRSRTSASNVVRTFRCTSVGASCVGLANSLSSRQRSR